MAAIREELTLVDRFSAQFTKFITLSERASASVDDIRFSLANIETATAATARAVDRLTDQLNGMDRQTQQVERHTDALTGKVRQLVSAYVGLQGVKSLLSLSDQLVSVRSRLDRMNDGLQTTEQLNQMIYDSAMRTGSAYLDTAAFVSNLGTLAGSAFSGNAEIVAFAEQINKQMALSGTSTAEAQGAMLQLTQALSSGVLRGEELNSVMEQTPMIAQTIAQYLGVSTGEMRELASEGKITADVVKNALFAAADETNRKFEEMPLTWGRVWNQIQNTLLQALEPVLDAVGALASFVGDNLDTVIAAFYGLAAAVAVYTLAQSIATGAASTFFKTLMKNPIFWIATIIGIVVMAIVKWIQAMGGLKIAWAVATDKILYVWDALKAGFMTGVYWIMGLFDKLGYAWQAVGVGIANFLGDLKVTVLLLLQNMINGAIDLLNDFINIINKLPGVNFDLIDKLTFGTNAAMANELEKAERNAELEEARQEIEDKAAERSEALAQMWEDRQKDHLDRLLEIEKMREENEDVADEYDDDLPYEPPPTDAQMEDLLGSVEGIEKAVSATEEDLQSLVDMATRQYVNRINLTAQTPVITVNGANTGNTAADRQSIANAIRDILVEQLASGSSVSMAGTF